MSGCGAPFATIAESVSSIKEQKHSRYFVNLPDEKKHIAIQCKFYSHPIGNKSVQEVAAGAKYYSSECACVVSNQTYTKSAKDLALSLNVSLLHDGQLIDYLDRL